VVLIVRGLHNRYTYVGNNPLSYTDPSGFFSFRDVLKFVGVLLNFIPGFQGWGQTWWQMMLKGFVNGFLAGGGDLKAGLLGAFGAPLFAGAGAFASYVISAAIQGGLTAAMGGKFKEGFLGSFANNFLGARFRAFGGVAGTGNIGDLIKRVIRDAVVGGISAEVGGGKFKNGAAFSAFGSLFTEIGNASNEIRKEEIQDRKFEEQPDSTNAIMSEGVSVREVDGITYIDVSLTARSDRFVAQSDAKQYIDAVEAYWSGTATYGGRNYVMTVNIQYLGPTGAGRSSDLFITGVSSQDIGFSNPKYGLIGITGREYPSTPAHEFGHVLGLEHRWSQNSIMNDYRFDNSRGVTGYDYSRVARLYGK